MKKIYMQPQMAVHKIELTTLIAESMILDGEKTLEEGEILSKRRGAWDVWDDEEE